MKRIALFALVSLFICGSVPDALARGFAVPSFKAPAPFIGPSKFIGPSRFIGPTKFIGSTKPFAGALPVASGPKVARRYVPPGNASTNPYGTPAGNNPSTGPSVGGSSPAALSYASTAQYRSICRIADGEEGAGGTCRYHTTVSKSRGDKCQCHGQSGTIQ